MPISVISVAGPYRSGKSYLLNRILGDQQGFEIGPTINPQTKGIWIWGSPMQVGDRCILLMDTEGLKSAERDENVDTKIFALSVLLSSLFIFNTMGVIDEDALDQINLICNLTQYIHYKANEIQESSNPEELFPEFVWVLRDFSLQLIDDDGNQITDNEYLESCLHRVRGDSSEVREKNRIRSTIKRYFQNRECVTLIRPVNSESKLRNIQDVPYEDLKSEFRQKVESLVTNIWQNAPVKQVEGVPVNGAMLASLLQSYIDAITADQVPNISTAWERAIHTILNSTFEKCINTYQGYFQEKVHNSLPIDEIDLKEHDNKARNKIKQMIAQLPSSAGTIQLAEETKQQVYKEISDYYQSVELSNIKKSKEQCQHIINQLFSEFEQTVTQSDSFQWLNQVLSDLRTEYCGSAKGPVKFQVGFDKYSIDIGPIISRIVTKTEQFYKQQLKNLQEQVFKLQGEREGLLENFHNEKKELVDLIEYERRYAREDKRNLEEALEEARGAMSSNNEEFGKLHRNLQDENLLLKKQLASARQSLAREQEKNQQGGDSVNIDDFKRMLHEIMSEATQLGEKERFLLQQYEYEKKLTIAERNSQKLLTEARRQSEDAINELKRSYEHEIRDLKEDKIALEFKLRDMSKELTARDLHIKLLNEKLRNKESEKKLRVEHADLLCSVSDLILKFLKKLEGTNDPSLRRDIDQLQLQAQRLSVHR